MDVLNYDGDDFDVGDWKQWCGFMCECMIGGWRSECWFSAGGNACLIAGK